MKPNDLSLIEQIEFLNTAYNSNPLWFLDTETYL
jgi:hypothetical protein